MNVVTFSSNPNEEGRPYGGPWVVDCEREELLECYSGWEPEVGELLKVIQHFCLFSQDDARAHSKLCQCIDNPTKWAIHQLKPLPFFVSGRVALIGDSVSYIKGPKSTRSNRAVVYVGPCDGASPRRRGWSGHRGESTETFNACIRRLAYREMVL